MSQNVHTLSPDQTVREGIQLMDRHNIGAVVVTEGGAVRGILSERDVVRRVLAKKRGLSTKVAEAMTPAPLSVSVDAPIMDVIGMMDQHRFRHVIVMDGRRLAGMISATDVIALSAF